MGIYSATGTAEAGVRALALKARAAVFGRQLRRPWSPDPAELWRSFLSRGTFFLGVYGSELMGAVGILKIPGKATAAPYMRNFRQHGGGSQ